MTNRPPYLRCASRTPDDGEGRECRRCDRTGREPGEAAFLRRLIDAIRQGATRAEIAASLAERAGWTPDEVFALAEELGGPPPDPAAAA